LVEQEGDNSDCNIHPLPGIHYPRNFSDDPKEEKEKYDELALCRFMGKMIFVLSFCMLLWPASELFGMQWLFGLGLGLFIGIVLIMVVYINTGNRLKK
jgi:hypothetical protein